MNAYGDFKYYKRIAILAGSVIYALGTPGYAKEGARPWQVHGFASQAFITTSHNDFFGTSSDNGSFGFSELGLNASVRAQSKLQFAGQLLSRRAGAGNSGEIQLDYLLTDYRSISREQFDLGFRIGRIKNPLGLYNETRDVAFTRPGLILPQSIYFDRTRNIALSADGVHIYSEIRTDIGDFDFQVEAAYPLVDDEDTEVSLLGGNRPGNLRPELSYLGRIMYTYKEGRFRLAYSGAEVNIDYRAGQNDANGNGALQFFPSVISTQYNSEKWEITGEYAVRKFNFEDLQNYIPYSTLDGESYYVQTTYHITNNWDFLLRYDVTFLNKDDKNGAKFALLTNGRRPAHSQFAKDLTVGVRWDPWRNWMVRAEYHIINGTAWLPVQDNPNPADTEQYWTMFGVLLSYRF